jgi:glycosyltransferase involved in cell wall biosynthesis
VDVTTVPEPADAATTTPADAPPVELSVVIPAYNEAASIGAQLDALRAQSWDGSWEIVVVDNRSTDATPEIVEGYARRDARVRLVGAPERAGLNFARNAGVAASRGRSFALCDADDLVAAGWLTAMGDALRSHEVVTGPLELDRLNPPWLAASRGRGDERGLPTFQGLFPTVHGNNMGMRRARFEEVGRFDLDDRVIGVDDVELSLRIAQHGLAVHFAPDAIVHYRYRDEPRALWRQGRTYGRARPFLVRRLREQGLPAPHRVAGWRSWLWLGVHRPDLRTHEGRAGWVWVAANRVGQLEGSARYRSLYL